MNQELRKKEYNNKQQATSIKREAVSGEKKYSRNLSVFHSPLNTNKGFALLFAVLVSTLVLAIGASVISIALKQIVLASSSRDSQFAFYAANTGIECAIYWDLNTPTEGNVFATSTGSSLHDSDDVIRAAVTCGEQEIIDDDSSCDGDINNNTGWCVDRDSGSSAMSKFRISFNDTAISEAERLPYCVDVIVSKNFDGTNIETTIESRGYNTCDENNPRRIERGLRISY